MENNNNNFVHAVTILEQAIKTLGERGQLRDPSGNERSMEAVINTFNTLTGLKLTEYQGWIFMITLKLIRAGKGKLDLDSFVDMAAYAALAGEHRTKLNSGSG